MSTRVSSQVEGEGGFPRQSSWAAGWNICVCNSGWRPDLHALKFTLGCVEPSGIDSGKCCTSAGAEEGRTEF